MASSRQLLEEAVAAAVIARAGTTAIGGPGGYVATVGPYNGELGNDAVTIEDIRRVCRRGFPAVLIGASAARVDSQSVTARRYQRMVDLDIACVSIHRRSREYRLLEDTVAGGDGTADQGIYDLLDDVHHAIAGYDLGLSGTGYIRAKREDPVVQAAELTAWLMTFEVRLDANQPATDFAASGVTAIYIEGLLAYWTGSPNPITESLTTFP